MVQKNRTSERRRPRAYESLQDWMERTGTNGRQLLALMREHGFKEMSAGHLSNVLKGSRRCSLKHALVLHELTGVPIQSMPVHPSVLKLLANVQQVQRSRTSQANAGNEAA